MQPMNYTIQTGDPGAAFSQGMERTAGMMATVADYQKAQALATAAQQKAEHDAYKRNRFMQVAQNPKSKDVQGLLLEFPELHEGLSKSLEFMSADEKRNTQEIAYSVTAALEKGNVDAATKVIDTQLEAAKRSNNQESIRRLEMLRDSVVASPDAARFGLKGMLFATMGGKDYGDMMKNLEAAETESQTRQATVEKGKADAVKAGADAVISQAKAKFAESDAAMELQKKGWDIKKIQADIDIAKQNSRIAAMNAQTSRMGVGIQAQKLQLDLRDAINKRDETVRTKAYELEQARSTTDDMLNTIAKIKKNPMLGRVVGVVGGHINTAPLNDDAIDAIALLESFSSEAFLAQREKLKGGGSITDFEGKKGADALANVTRKQSLKQLMESLNEAERRLLKGRKQLAEKYGAPDTIPDTPAASAKTAGKSTDAILKELGVLR